MLGTNNSIQRTIRWLWYPYIPMGGITLIQGTPGTGKSLLLAELAAEASLYYQEIWQMMGESPYVLLQCADDRNSVVRSRLQMSGACLNRVSFCEQLNHHRFSIREIPSLQRLCDKNFALILIDPIEAFMRDQCNSQSIGTYVHGLIQQLNLQARLNDWALVLTTAHNTIYGTASDRELGRMEGFKEIKSVLKIQTTGISENNHIIMQTRNEYAPCGTKLQFQIDEKIGIQWIGQRPDFHSKETKFRGDKIFLREAVVDYMKKIFANGEVPAKEVVRSLMDVGFKDKTIMMAKKLSGVSSVRRDRQWFWRL